MPFWCVKVESRAVPFFFALLYDSIHYCGFGMVWVTNHECLCNAQRTNYGVGNIMGKINLLIHSLCLRFRTITQLQSMDHKIV